MKPKAKCPELEGHGCTMLRQRSEGHPRIRGILLFQAGRQTWLARLAVKHEADEVGQTKLPGATPRASATSAPRRSPPSASQARLPLPVAPMEAAASAVALDAGGAAAPPPAVDPARSLVEVIGEQASRCGYCGDKSVRATQPRHSTRSHLPNLLLANF
jgi:hypothetical protein